MKLLYIFYKVFLIFGRVCYLAQNCFTKYSKISNINYLLLFFVKKFHIDEQQYYKLLLSCESNKKL